MDNKECGVLTGAVLGAASSMLCWMIPFTIAPTFAAADRSVQPCSGATFSKTHMNKTVNIVYTSCSVKTP